MSFDIITIDEHNYSQVLDLLEICFPNAPREYFEEHHRRDPAYNFNQVHALSDGDQIVATLSGNELTLTPAQDFYGSESNSKASQCSGDKGASSN